MDKGVLWRRRPDNQTVAIGNARSAGVAAMLLAWSEVIHFSASLPTWVKLLCVAGIWFQRLTAIMIMTGVLVLGAKRVWEGDNDPK